MILVLNLDPDLVNVKLTVYWHLFSGNRLKDLKIGEITHKIWHKRDFTACVEPILKIHV